MIVKFSFRNRNHKHISICIGKRQWIVKFRPLRIHRYNDLQTIIMQFIRANEKLPPVGLYNATYNGDHVIFQVHDGGFRVINYHGEFNDQPKLSLVKWLDESGSI